MDSNLLYNYFASTHQGLVRTNNEDAHGDTKTKHGHVFIVCDGMGGHAAGERASQIAVDTIADFLKTCENENHRENLKNAIKAANSAILEEVANDPSLKGMGTTCVVLYLFNNGQMLLGHVGDSRIYEYYNHTLKRTTKDHSYVQFLVDSGEITAEEAETHKSKNQILRALGSDENVKPQISEFMNPNSKTCFILCSDGLNDMVNDKAIEAILNKYDTISLETVEHLVSEALNAGGKDNVTVGLLEVIKNDNQTAPVFRASSSTEDVQPPPNTFKKYLLLGLLAVVLLGVIRLFSNRGEQEQSDNNAPTQTADTLTTPKDSATVKKRDSTSPDAGIPDSIVSGKDSLK